MTNERFWLEDPKYLFTKLKIIPKDNMTLETQMNSLSRLVIFIFLILYLLQYKQAVLFLLLSLFFIIILYYLQKSKMTTRENFLDDMRTVKKQVYKDPIVNNVNNINTPKNLDYIYKTEKLYNDFVNQDRYAINKFPSYYNQQIEKEFIIEPDQSFVSSNQNLVGGANPKTKIRPVVAPPSHDWEHWRANDFVFPNAMNERSVQDYYSSGYYVDESIQCPKKKDRLMVQTKENYTVPKPVNTRKENIKENYNFNNSSRSNNYFPISGSQDANEPPSPKSCKTCKGGPYDLQPSSEKLFKMENGDFKKFDKNSSFDIDNKRSPGDIDDACGYDQSNLYYDLPSNYSSTNCQRRNDLKELNGQVFTSTVVPSVYYKNQIIEPISSNIGISFTQQIPPRKISYDKDGNKIYTAMDPRLYSPDLNDPVEEDFNVTSNYDVTDPRTNGYGTSYRSYIDKLTGQPRFYYDDVESVRRPNYIIRSDVDFLKTADSYGPIKDDNDEIDVAENMRKNAEYAYLDNTIDFRNDMMVRLMRKRNAELWQVRMAPKAGMKK